MQVSITYPFALNDNRGATIDVPKECPVCNLRMNLSPTQISYNPTTKEIQVVYLCVDEDCKSFFITYYKEEEPNTFKVKRCEPANLAPVAFPDFVKDLSPMFLTIYKQAHEAQERGLDQIAGPGYRKAFEFLIKDYAKSIRDDKSDSIDSTPASAVVNNFISDTRVQAVAVRALWVGNDETHYIREWKDRDINDLIKLINLTLDWIEIERDSKTYVEEMEGKKKKSASKASTTT